MKQLIVLFNNNFFVIFFQQIRNAKCYISFHHISFHAEVYK